MYLTSRVESILKYTDTVRMENYDQLRDFALVNEGHICVLDVPMAVVNTYQKEPFQPCWAKDEKTDNVLRRNTLQRHINSLKEYVADQDPHICQLLQDVDLIDATARAVSDMLYETQDLQVRMVGCLMTLGLPDLFGAIK